MSNNSLQQSSSIHSLLTGHPSLSRPQSGFSGHSVKINTLLKNISLETKALLKLAAGIEEMEMGNPQQKKLTAEPLIRQVDSTMDFMIMPAKVSPVIVVGKLIYGIREEMKRLLGDPSFKFGKEVDMTVLEELMIEIGYTPGADSAGGGGGGPGTPLNITPTSVSSAKSTTASSPDGKSPGVIKRVLSMMKSRPTSTVEGAGNSVTSKLFRSKSAAKGNEDTKKSNGNVSINFANASSQSICDLPEVPMLDLATVEKIRQMEIEAKGQPLGKAADTGSVSPRLRSVSLKPTGDERPSSWLPPSPTATGFFAGIRKSIIKLHNDDDVGVDRESDTMDEAELLAAQAKRPVMRSKSLVPTDKDVLLLAQAPPAMPPIQPKCKSVKSSQANLASSRYSLAPPLPSGANSLSASTQDMAAALFGDPNMSVAAMPCLDDRQKANTFAETANEKKVHLEINMTNNQMRFVDRMTKKKLFEVDLSKWESESNITVHDFRDGFKRTEIMEILRNPKNPNMFSICAHTVMLSNLLPLGTIVIDSAMKITVHVESRGAINSKPVFSITGEISNGRFMVIGRDKNSRAQKQIGTSSGWVTKRKLKLVQNEYRECNLEIDDSVFSDQVNYNASSEEVDVLMSQLKELETDTVTRLSQLLMAGIVLGLAPKE
ncbi:hypothetical protein BCR33DRAFT_712351 [Rhizoclosmatium globosum]|uniref:Uncharacterized protein n=1 Tax=Rhizoclosmatium globosum TaxID=329046 RepID=A0A1Y2CY36_9FUNG|nr:hypothetical protein BCR33DRAFT_712351 [Rhizoclosmatium globosum]|eukprot:ORY51245.1 hypothetical protein BCR33DRAFT_712351 [Rhizoclosmatium globosum]